MTDLNLFKDDQFNRLFDHLKGFLPKISNRVLIPMIFILVAWCPILLLAHLSGNALSSTIAYKLVIENASISQFGVVGTLAGFVICAPLVFLLPLIMFFPKLYKAKQEQLIRFSKLANDYTAAFRDICVEHTTPLDLDEVSGTVQGMADLISWYEHARTMRVVPFDLRTLLKLFMSAIAPVSPVIVKIMPWPWVKNFLSIFSS